MPTPTERRPAWAFLKIALGLAILAAALWSVPWRDSVRLRTEGGEVRVAGELVGDWSGASARWRIDQDAAPQPAWPSGWSSAQEAGETVLLQRDLAQLDAGELDWRPGLATLLTGLRWSALLFALAIVSVGIAASIVRWWTLLAVGGCALRLREVLRLSLLGLFFSLVIPGLTGGDLVKVALVVRENPGRRIAAFASTLLDRAFGLVGLAVLASAVVLYIGEPLQRVRTPVLIVGALATVGLAGLLHPAPRRWLRLERWLERGPLGRRIGQLDDSLRSFAAHPQALAFALALSAANHACVAWAVYTVAESMGSTLSFGTTLCIVSIASFAAAVPISPGGLGVEEAVYASLFALFGAPPAIGLAAGLSKRALYTLIRLAGGSYLLMPGRPALRSLASLESP